MFNLPIGEEKRTLAEKKSGKWFRRVKEAAEQYMKHWLVKEMMENVAKTTIALSYKKRSNFSKTSLGP